MKDCISAGEVVVDVANLRRVLGACDPHRARPCSLAALSPYDKAVKFAFTVNHETGAQQSLGKLPERRLLPIAIQKTDFENIKKLTVCQNATTPRTESVRRGKEEKGGTVGNGTLALPYWNCTKPNATGYRIRRYLGGGRQ